MVGGGPAGMMAATRAADLGARVLLVEKNPKLGKKLLITGGGRCNVTNTKLDRQRFSEHFGDSSKFLFSSFSRFDAKDTLSFFHARNMPTKVETEGRVFPKSDQSQSVLDVLKASMRKSGVSTRCATTVEGLCVENERLVGIRVSGSKTPLLAKSIIIATGGTSRPDTGSTGEGFDWLASVGHTIVTPNLSLVPIRIEERWVRDLSGLSLKDISVSVFSDDKKHAEQFGKMIFTHFGVSGPAVLNVSGVAHNMHNDNKKTHIALDLFPNSDASSLDQALRDLFEKNQNKQVKNMLVDFVSPRLVSPLLELSLVNPDTPVHSLPREQRLTLIATMKHLPMSVSGFLGKDKAIVTRGGVPLSEVDCRFMQSRLHKNLYIIGDLLDIERPSGGYSLQLCWTTGWIAGTKAGEIN